MNHNLKDDDLYYVIPHSGVKVNRDTGEGDDGRWYFPEYTLKEFQLNKEGVSCSKE